MLTIINPLEGGLDHYVAALADVLRASGCHSSVEQQLEPSRSGQGRLRWGAEHLRQIRAHRADPQLLAWPAVGLMDLAALGALSTGLRALVVHDPVPLVRGVGYGRVARRLAQAVGSGVEVIVHSEAAAADLPASLGAPTRLPMPVLEPVGEPRPASTSAVRVVGRYKAGRDIEALEALAPLGREGVQLEIFGRGWPPVAGWSVVSDRFVDTQTFTRSIATSSVVVIPYRRFYQSDVAVRALEAGVPVVGPRASSLADLLGPESPWLVDAVRGWRPAVEAALEEGGAAATDRARVVRELAVTEWRLWLSGHGLLDS